LKVFNNYSKYYDLIYSDKDYTAETQYIHSLLQKYAPNTKSILELGCGTGIHAISLGRRGYEICGIDNSIKMLKCAEDRLLHISGNQAPKISFAKGNIRSIRLKKHFDAVIALFHVINYQVTNRELQDFFKTVSYHLKPGGFFIFDSWYGPSVLNDLPTVRIKRVEDKKVGIIRISEPCLHSDENFVDVNYQILITDKITGLVEELREKHRVRYLFKPEIDFFCSEVEIELVDYHEWLTQIKPDLPTWSVCFITRAYK